MNLKIILPASLFLETRATKIKAEGPEGGFCLLPRHSDFVCPLTPGLFSYVPEQEKADRNKADERFYALDKGLLVKHQDSVLVATSNATAGELGHLEQAVQNMLEAQDEQERKSRTHIARMEADFVKRFIGFGHGS